MACVMEEMLIHDHVQFFILGSGEAKYEAFSNLFAIVIRKSLGFTLDIMRHLLI